MISDVKLVLGHEGFSDIECQNVKIDDFVLEGVNHGWQMCPKVVILAKSGEIHQEIPVLNVVLCILSRTVISGPGVRFPMSGCQDVPMFGCPDVRMSGCTIRGPT